MDQIKIGEFLKTLRKEKNLTQQEAADALYVSQKTISRWETGEGMPDISAIQEIAMFYGVSVDELLNGERKSEIKNNVDYKKYNDERKKEKIQKKINSYFLTCLGMVVFTLVIMILLTTILQNLEKPIYIEDAAILIINLSILVSIGIYIYGNYDIKSNMDEITESLRKTVKKKNSIFSDVMALLVLLEISIFYSINTNGILPKLAIFILLLLSYYFLKSYFVENDSFNFKNLNKQIQKIMLVCEILIIILIFNFVAKNISFVPDDYLNINLLFSTEIVRKYVFRIISIIIILATYVGLILVRMKKKYIFSYPLLLLGISGNALIFCDVFITWNDNTMKSLEISQIGIFLILYYLSLNILLLTSYIISKKKEK